MIFHVLLYITNSDHLTLKDLSVPVFKDQAKTQCGTLKVCPVQTGPVVLPQTSGPTTLYAWFADIGVSNKKHEKCTVSKQSHYFSVCCLVLRTALLAATWSL